MGATETINNTAEDPVKAIKEIVPRGVTYAIDTTGNTGVIKSAIDSLATAGECVLLGVCGDITLNLMNDILSESKKISGVVEGDSNPQEFIPQLVKYYKQGKFPLISLLSTTILLILTKLSLTQQTERLLSQSSKLILN